MINMKINRKPFWVRHIVNRDGIATYSEPSEIKINLFPTNSHADLYGLGKEYYEYMRAKLPMDEASEYNIGDLIYDIFPIFADTIDIGNATYRIDAILPVLNISEIRCKRVSGSETIS